MLQTPPVFSPEKIDLFNKRFEEGYDLFDDDYLCWLQAYHPDECSLPVSQQLCFDSPPSPISPAFGSTNYMTPSPHSSEDPPLWSPSRNTTLLQVSSTPSRRTPLFSFNQASSHCSSPPFGSSSWSYNKQQTTPLGPLLSPLGHSSWSQSLPPPGHRPPLHLNSSWSYNQQQTNYLDYSSWSSPEQRSTPRPINPPVSSKHFTVKLLIW